MGISHDERDIFQYFNVKERSGYTYIQPGASARTRSHRGLNETRGRKPKLSEADVATADSLLEDTGFNRARS